jgi:hypothetical protein
MSHMRLPCGWDRTGEQDGPANLGDAHEERRLPRSGVVGGMIYTSDATKAGTKGV